MLLDEPTRGIDVGAKAEIYQLIRRLASEGRAIVMTSSELPELLAVSDRIIVLCEGRLAADIPRAEATEEAIMHAATSFLDRSGASVGKLHPEPRHFGTQGRLEMHAIILITVLLRPLVLAPGRSRPISLDFNHRRSTRMPAKSAMRSRPPT